MVEFTGERVIPSRVDPDLMNEHLARYAFAARLARGKRVLDAGCGAGYGSAELAKSAAFVLGADSSTEAIAFARENYRLPNLHFTQAAVEALPHRDATFDLLVAFEVIEHLERWREFLLEVRRVLAPAGQFMVSTPNKVYYAETRALAGPNPFHVHEFDFAEFRDALHSAFPHISIFLENHSEGVVFQPLEAESTAEVRIDGPGPAPAESHFFVAVCAHRPQVGNPTFVFIPHAGNVLREREQHIALLREELAQKDAWLEKATGDLAALNQDHQKLLARYRQQLTELEERNRWALQLNQELAERVARIDQLQQEFAREQAEARAMAEGYERKVVELEGENREKTEWALETGRRLEGEIEERTRELAECVERLHAAEQTIEERTVWVGQLQEQIKQLQTQIGLARESRWLKLGRSLGVGPQLPER